MYISTKHYLQSVVYVYDASADAATRVTINAIHVISTKAETITSYEVQRADGTTAVVSEDVCFDSAASAFYSIRAEQVRKEVEAEIEAKRAEKEAAAELVAA